MINFEFLTQVYIMKNIHFFVKEKSFRITAKMAYRYYPIHQEQENIFDFSVQTTTDIIC